MRSLLLALILVSSSPLAWGQGPTCPPSVAISAEPENHAVEVDRLMRYHDSGEYEREIREVVNSAREFLESRYPRSVLKEAKIAAVFDIDETALSNWEVMAGCGFCAYSTQLQLYKDSLYSNAHDPAIAPVLELFNFVKGKGISVFFVTGRSESERDRTVSNLQEAGYSGWENLYMQPDVAPSQHKPPARIFKPKDRQAIEKLGYTIVLNIGDQASDLAGCCATRVLKLPNPFYLVP